MTPEGRVKAAIKRWLDKRGVWHFSPVSNGMGVHGIPDIIACWKGRFIGIEVKAPGKTGAVTELQKFQINGINAAGGVAVVVDSVSALEEALRGRVDV